MGNPSNKSATFINSGVKPTNSIETSAGSFQMAIHPDAPDFRDWRYQPPLIELKTKLDPPSDLVIRDQGAEGACTGFGLAAVINRLCQMSGRQFLASEMMLYDMARRYDEWSGEDYEGSSCRGAIEGWYNMGVCHDDDWRMGDPVRHLTVARAKEARKTTIGAYYRIADRISDFHAALNECGVIYCSAKVHDGWSRVKKTTGDIELSDKGIGGHAFAIVGYDEIGFWVQNSWGTGWGKKGLARWSYQDWQINLMDAWVLRLALSTPQIWHLDKPNKSSANSARDPALASPPLRSKIAGHFIHIDDGKFCQNGRYWSTLDDVKETATFVAKSDKYDHLLVYAHGGLNSPVDSARRIQKMKDTFKANRIYPYHFMYDTGIMEELKDVLLSRKDQVKERAGGLRDWIDKILEQTTRIPGRALWREMKSGATLPFESSVIGRPSGPQAGDTEELESEAHASEIFENSGAGFQAVQVFLDEFWQQNKKIGIHLVGHSTGGILLAHLLKALEDIAPTLRINTCSLMAPAATIDLFRSHYYPRLAVDVTEAGIDDLTIYNLAQQLELDDTVAKIYGKSLLYLVSRAFEERRDEKILGIQAHAEKILVPQHIPNLNFEISRGKIAGARTMSTSHGGFDDDPATLNDILRRVLKKKPLQPFTAEQFAD